MGKACPEFIEGRSIPNKKALIVSIRLTRLLDRTSLSTNFVTVHPLFQITGTLSGFQTLTGLSSQYANPSPEGEKGWVDCYKNKTKG